MLPICGIAPDCTIKCRTIRVQRTIRSFIKINKQRVAALSIMWEREAKIAECLSQMRSEVIRQGVVDSDKEFDDLNFTAPSPEAREQALIIYLRINRLKHVGNMSDQFYEGYLESRLRSKSSIDKQLKKVSVADVRQFMNAPSNDDPIHKESPATSPVKPLSQSETKEKNVVRIWRSVDDSMPIYTPARNDLRMLMVETFLDEVADKKNKALILLN